MLNTSGINNTIANASPDEHEVVEESADVSIVALKSILLVFVFIF